MERELTALEQRLYKFLDDIDSIVEYDMSKKRWEVIRNLMSKCKMDCKVEYGVINNGYSLHIHLPFDVEAYMNSVKNSGLLSKSDNEPSEVCDTKETK